MKNPEDSESVTFSLLQIRFSAQPRRSHYYNEIWYLRIEIFHYPPPSFFFSFTATNNRIVFVSVRFEFSDRAADSELLFLFQVLGVCLAVACVRSPTKTKYVFTSTNCLPIYIVYVMKLQFFLHLHWHNGSNSTHTSTRQQSHVHAC